MTIRVYTNEPTSFGDRKVSIGTFKDSERPKADAYFGKLVKEIAQDSKETDDVLYVIMEDVGSDKRLKEKYFNN